MLPLHSPSLGYRPFFQFSTLFSHSSVEHENIVNTGDKKTSAKHIN